MKVSKPFRVRLSATGNPDFGQYGSIGIRTKHLRVASLREAAIACVEFIAQHDLGSGNWTGGVVSDPAGNFVAYVSFNGSVWPTRPRDWQPGQQPILRLTTDEYKSAHQRGYDSIMQANPRRATSPGNPWGLVAGDVVQFRFEPGTGGVIQREFRGRSWVATSRGVREVPTDALRKARPEHEARVRRQAWAKVFG